MFSRELILRVVAVMLEAGGGMRSKSSVSDMTELWVREKEPVPHHHMRSAAGEDTMGRRQVAALHLGGLACKSPARQASE
ncbi:UNVERIFIED_CONTAM: hypothetical protein K2H54_045512 [Gekko kuhli]